MRTKVYGKKSRAPPAGVLDVFTRDSPPAQPKERDTRLKIHSEERALKEKPRNVVERIEKVCKAAKEEFPEGQDDAGLQGRRKEREAKSAKVPVPREANATNSGPKTKDATNPKPHPRARPRKSPIPTQQTGTQQDGPTPTSAPRAPATNPNDLAPLLQRNLTLNSPTRAGFTSKSKSTTTTRSRSRSRTQAPSSPPSLHPPSAPRPSRPAPPTPLLPPSTLTYLAPLLTCPNTTPHPIPISTLLPPSLPLLKIGEGAYGEVYRCTHPSSRATSILKVLPLAPPRARPGNLTAVAAACAEIRLLEKMHRVPGFVRFRGACVAVGAMPPSLVREWVRYRDAGRTVGTRDPRRRGYGRGQLWVVLEMADAGACLEGEDWPLGWGEGGEREGGNGERGKGGDGKWKGEGGRYLSVKRGWDVFWQVVSAVAKGEVWAGFEHRDLHLGNICAKDTQEDRGGDGWVGGEEEDLSLVGKEEKPCFGLRCTGVEVTVIDYSLSRARGTGMEVLFTDFLKDEALLRGEGDLQYDIYRYVAEAVRGVAGLGEEGCGEEVSGEEGCGRYVPKTNVLWLAYLIRKLLDVTLEVSEEGMVEREGKVTRVRRMRGILEEVRDMLVFEEREGWEVGSAGDLVEWGVRRGWFRPEEVIG